MLQKNQKIEVGAYYFPNFHPGEPLNEEYHGRDWDEWRLVKAATPKFPGHRQPKIPVWGYGDESRPEIMERKIDAASRALDYFIFDWYWYNGEPAFNRCLDNGFLGAANRDRMKFCLMWTNHDWVNGHPSPYSRYCQTLRKGAESGESFFRMVDYIIEHYFSRPNYYKIDGAPYFSIYQSSSLFEVFPSVAELADALREFRARVKRAGFPDLHLNLIYWRISVLPCEKPETVDLVQRIRSLGIDSIASYVWVHHVALNQRETPFHEVCQKYFSEWDRIRKIAPGIPYFPNVSVGWDPSPRTLQTDTWDWRRGYPFCGIISENTPENFETALRQVRTRMEEMDVPTLNINSWNEWTEGSMLEPEEQYGYGYLDAIKRVFGPRFA